MIEQRQNSLSKVPEKRVPVFQSDLHRPLLQIMQEVCAQDVALNPYLQMVK